MTESAEEQRVQAKIVDLESAWTSRDNQWNRDRALLALQYKRRILPFESITSNEPAVLHSGAIAILGGKPPIYRLPIVNQNLDEIEKMNKSERFIQGIMREVDKRWRMKGHGPWLLDLLYHACLGGVAVMPRIVKESRKAPEFHCDIFDPIQVYPSYGEEGLLSVARIYETTFDHAKSIAVANGWDMSPVAETKEVKLASYWEMGNKENEGEIGVPYETVLMGGHLMKPWTAHDEFSRIPLLVYPMNGAPWRGFVNSIFQDGQMALNSEDWTVTWGRPIFWANRELYLALDRLLTYEAERSRKMARAKYVYRAADGQISFSQEDFEGAQVVVVDASQGEELNALQPPSMSREAFELINQLFSMMQRAGLNRLALGDLSLEISGVTLERAAASARYVLEPYADGVRQVLSDIAMTFFEQARTMRLSKVSLAVRQANMGADLAYQVEEFSKDDIPKTTYVEVELPMLLPDDRMRDVTIARTLIPGNLPLADRQTVAEDVLHIQDWPKVKQRMDEDAVEQSPALQAVKQMAAVRRLIDEWSAIPELAGQAEEATMALAIMREQFRQITAPRDQSATVNPPNPNASEPTPAIQPSEAGLAAPTGMEVAAGAPMETRPKVMQVMRGQT